MFHQARLKLTLWYTLIIMFMSIAFSLVIFQLMSREVERFAALQRTRLERRLYDTFLLDPDAPIPDTLKVAAAQAELVQDLKHRLALQLLIINGTILVVSASISYIFASKTLAPIKEMVQEQHRFIGDASHEFRTPLTSLKSAFEVFLRDKKPRLIEARVVMQDSLEEVNKLQALSDSLLQLTQYQIPNGNLQFEKISLQKTLQTAIRRIKPVAKKRHIAIKSTLREANVLGNTESLTDLWKILLDNAIKYSPDKTTITVNVELKRDKVSVQIADQGIGVSKKDLPHIFDRFYRADHARTKKPTGGYGLGLPIAKKIVDAHHGNVQVKSQVNKGSNFLVTLPKI